MDTTQKTGLGGLSDGLADAVERVAAGLVTVLGRPRQAATGLIIAPGLVLTADHVLEREDELQVVTGDGRELAAQFAGRDPSTDLAILKVNELGGTPVTQAAGAARVGQLVLAVGCPAPDGLMASLGIVSAVGGPLRTPWGVALEQFIRTDATPYPGFSGGPLVNVAGEVVGLTTTGLVNGVTLGVPAAVAWRVAESLAQHGTIKRGYLGISSQPVPLHEAQRGGTKYESGLLIVRVEQDSPAAQGGLLIGDVLVSFDGVPTGDTDSLQPLLTGARVGKEVPAEVIRAGVRQELKITVGERN
jgi:S1-C subfamily serine protease